ncbi:hypothetical protein [Candidatus Mycobacterium methanotrophicum]|uniref:Uncharacterized protein n=1 Tax=Candidatus Mycobacterium methanotrophicum TaxID=2943498 RepID=A0ABY4QQ11_9MYCO|nr:hypothetical protein [Candidatus Mycobacterium methanotrophicum]UQX12046.1 hypothetical protein M5I08_06820 [Candidatus Mycobacterium methanotrophicum]
MPDALVTVVLPYLNEAEPLPGYVNLKWPHRDGADWPHLKSSWSGLADVGH